jgi:hypothetical protein
MKLLSVARCDRFVCIVFGDFHKSKSARLARKTVANQTDCVQTYACLGKPTLQFVLTGFIWKIAYK